MTTRLAPILRALVDELYPPEDNQGDGDDHSEGTPAAPSPDLLLRPISHELEVRILYSLVVDRWLLECGSCGRLLIPTRDLLLEGIRPVRPGPDPRFPGHGFRVRVRTRRHALEAGWLHAREEHPDRVPYLRTAAL